MGAALLVFFIEEPEYKDNTADKAQAHLFFFLHSHGGTG